jgi:arylsulfatase A-like enzyme
MTQMPNIVLIHGHDLGRFLPCYGKLDVLSPHLDALAGESVVFDRAFATAPLCTPARSSLFTGLSPHENGLMGLAHSGWRYRQSVRTLPELLHPLGYDTALVGLQHEHPDPVVLGFGEVHGMGFLPRALPVAQEAETWLHDRRPGAKPFFLSVGMWEAHRPWSREDYEFADPGLVDVPEFLPDTPETREDLAGFYGAIRQLDHAVGRVVTAVDEAGHGDDTLIVFTTDHGAAFPRAKGTLYDPGVGVALIARPPRSWHASPGRCDALVSHLDLVPTFVDLANGTPEAALRGVSIAPWLRTDAASPGGGRSVFFEKTFHDGYDPVRAIRTDRYKLIRNFEAGPRLKLSKDLEESLTRRSMGDSHLAPRDSVELYDLDDDPHELSNVAEDPRYVEVRASLESALAEWMRETKDPVVDNRIVAPRPPSRSIDAQPDLSDELLPSSLG